MKIGEVIRKYRKEKMMTQEEMASCLGVTASAVNKWENGNSLPDVALLSPIARLLGITPDTLLSFHEELTQEEITHFIQELNDRLKQAPYDEVFQWAKKKLEQYPNCQGLFWQTALVLDARRKTNDIPDAEKYDSYICDCYTRALESKEESIRTRAADSLFSFYAAKGEYRKAEEYLNYFSSQSPECKRKQAYLFSKLGAMDKAWQAYEELLFSGYQMTSMIFHSMYQLAVQENDLEKARALTEKQVNLARLFEMGKYHALCCQLELAAEEKDTDAVIKLAEKLLESVSALSRFRTSFLYAHMSFKEPESDFTEELQKHLLESFRREEAYDFLKEDTRWQALIK